MSNSGSGGAWSGFDRIRRDTEHTATEPCPYPQDSDRPPLPVEAEEADEGE